MEGDVDPVVIHHELPHPDYLVFLYLPRAMLERQCLRLMGDAVYDPASCYPFEHQLEYYIAIG